MDVEFRFYQDIPSTRDEPEVPAEVVIEAVFVDGIEISNLIGDKTWDEIEAEILKLYDGKESV